MTAGCEWLRSVQNPDGGWGESCESDLAGCFVPRPMSTPSQTAWALEGLLAAGSRPQADPAVKRGIEFLIKSGIGRESAGRKIIRQGQDLPASYTWSITIIGTCGQQWLFCRAIRIVDRQTSPTRCRRVAIRSLRSCVISQSSGHAEVLKSQRGQDMTLQNIRLFISRPGTSAGSCVYSPGMRCRLERSITPSR